MKQLMMLTLCFIYANTAQAESVYECRMGDKYSFQSTPCASAAEVKKIKIQPFKPDHTTLERLDKQRMEYLEQANPSEFNRIRRAKMTPEERIADEKLEQQRLQQQFQQRQAERQLQLQQQQLFQQQQLEEQLARQQQQIEEQRAQQLWWRWQNLNSHQRFRPPHQNVQRPHQNTRPHQHQQHQR